MQIPPSASGPRKSADSAGFLEHHPTIKAKKCCHSEVIGVRQRSRLFGCPEESDVLKCPIPTELHSASDFSSQTALLEMTCSFFADLRSLTLSGRYYGRFHKHQVTFPLTVQEYSSRIEYIRLGESGLRVSRLCLGMMTHGEEALRHDPQFSCGNTRIWVGCWLPPDFSSVMCSEA